MRLKKKATEGGGEELAGSEPEVRRKDLKSAALLVWLPSIGANLSLLCISKFIGSPGRLTNVDRIPIDGSPPDLPWAGPYLLLNVLTLWPLAGYPIAKAMAQSGYIDSDAIHLGLSHLAFKVLLAGGSLIPFVFWMAATFII